MYFFRKIVVIESLQPKNKNARFHYDYCLVKFNGYIVFHGARSNAIL